MSLGFRSGVCTLVALAFAAACSAGPAERSRTSVTGSGASGGATSSGGTIGIGNGGSSGGVNLAGTGTGGAMGCQTGGVTWDPKIPTVYLLVDRSGSMFETGGGATTPWAALRTAAISVMTELQADVRFGFAAYSAYAEATSGAMCPAAGRFVDMPSVPPNLNNADAISAIYGGLEKPSSQKIDTGSSLAIDLVADLLWADTTDGEKYILFVTDGEPDYCDDPSPQCPIDSVVWTLQRLKAGLDRTGGTHAPISTIVLGVATSLTQLGEQALVQFANAGGGQPVAYLVNPGDSAVYTDMRYYYECQSVPGWAADLTASGKPTLSSVGTYSATGGTLTPFKPDPTDQAAIAAQISTALAGVKSCVFDLGGDIQVDLNQLDLAHVYVEGNVVPLDDTNGWRMNTSTQIELVGDACNTWRMPDNNKIDWDFPCEIIIPK